MITHFNNNWFYQTFSTPSRCLTDLYSSIKSKIWNTPNNSKVDTIQRLYIDQVANPSIAFTQKQNNFMQNLDNIDSLPTDNKLRGNSTVYFNKEIGLIFKEMLSKGALANRVNNNAMIRFHFLLRPFEERYHHLIIPRTVPLIFEKPEVAFLVEDCLPVTATNKVAQIALYEENREKFTPPIKELARLFCHAKITDLLDDGKAILDVRLRHDNLLLFIKENIGYAGLIDLEHFSILNDKEEYDFAKQLKVLPLFFPYHLDEIITEVQKYHPHIKKSFFTKEVEVGKFLIEKYYTGHKRFLEKNGITLENYDRKFEISDSDKKELQSIVLDILNTLFSSVETDKIFPPIKNDDPYFPKIEPSKHYQTLPQFREEFVQRNKEEEMPQLAKKLIDGLIDFFDKECIVNQPKDQMDLLDERKMSTNRFCIDSGWNDSINIEMYDDIFLDTLFALLMTKLQEKGVIYYFYKEQCSFLPKNFVFFF